MIDWRSTENYLLLNPRLPEETRQKFRGAWQSFIAIRFQGRIGIATSGSSGESFGRLIVLSKDAVLINAAAVNERLKSNSQDIWYRTLPIFHVGGLSILARAHLSGAQVVEDEIEKWNPQAFYENLTRSKATLLSLVPTQVFDLVRLGLQAPPSLRAVIVGGGRFNSHLREEALKLRWPVLPSYGMTEVASQIATAVTPTEPALKPLSHVQVRLGESGRLQVSSPALLDAQIIFNLHGEASLSDPKKDGWLETEDVAQINEDGTIEILGRIGDFIKIGGEGVVISRLEERLEKLKSELHFEGDAAVVAAKDDRLGAVIVLVSSADAGKTEELVDLFNDGVAPFEEIRTVHQVDSVPRSALGKLLRQPVLTLIGLESPTNL
ncbi:MAG TPA: AMP-binding protein [Bdellovibrionales bacterium]|nr:AMP-binding protein [Bdellovibrionales bacterium]